MAALAVSGEGRLIADLNVDGAESYNLETGKFLAYFVYGNGAVTFVEITGDGHAITNGSNLATRIWDIQSAQSCL